jgi:hypothetical protein
MKITHLRKPIRDRSRAVPRKAALQGAHPIPCAFRGQVVDARTGEPVAGARAALAEPLELLALLRPPPPSRRRSGLADGEGRFEIAAPPGRTFWLLVHHPRYLAELVEVQPDARDVRVALARPGAIRGRLLDATGAPVARARVRGLCPEALDAAEALTGPDGGFRLEGLRPGRWLLGPEGGETAGSLVAAVAEVSPGEVALAVMRPRRCAGDALC